MHMESSIEGTVKNPVKKSKRHLLLFNIGKFTLDAVKLSFGSLVVGTIIKGDFSESALLLSGVIVTVVGTIIGIYLITVFDEGKEEK
jgi:hypothetical protein